MAYASFHDAHEPVEPREITDGGLSQGKAIAKIYGYMGIGLLITGLVAFFSAWLFISNIAFVNAQGQIVLFDNIRGWGLAVIVTWIVSLIAIIILSFVIPVRAARSGKSLWVPYVLYCIFMGFLLSAVLLTGIPFWMIGEAFGLTCLAFAGMFAIGWFAKKDISILGFIALNLLMAALLVGLVTALIYVFGNVMSWFVFRWIDVGISAIMIVAIMLITAVDTYRIKQIVARGGATTNLYLFGAYVMYTDFIALLLRILYLIARLQGNR